VKDGTATPHIDALIVFRKNNKVAFLLRHNTRWMDGFYGLPGGKVEHGEAYSAAAVREAKEETGITMTPENLKHVLTMHRHSDDGDWVDVIFEAHDWVGEPINNEPNKHAELKWFLLTNLPQNIIPVTRYYLELVSQGKSYGEYGW
jgi:8-oxo-dGTP diphosphatase